jgi:hypothetical protein
MSVLIYVGESGKEFAERLLNDKYGKGNYDKGSSKNGGIGLFNYQLTGVKPWNLFT